MPDNLNTGDIVLTRIVCTAAARYSYNLRHYRVDLNGGAMTTLDVASAVADGLAPSMLALMAQEATILGCMARRIHPTLGSEEYSPTVYGPMGFGSGGLLPLQLCALITMPFVGRFKGPKGRWYHPFIAADATTDMPRLNDEYFMRLQLHASVLTTTLLCPTNGGPGLITPVIHRRKTGVFADITSWECHRWLSTQRRRSQVHTPITPGPF